MIEVTWTFTKVYTPEEFQNKVSESNDVQRLGYFEIAADWSKVDSSDDMHIEFSIKDDDSE